MPEPSAIDLATADSWFGVKPGMSRSQVAAAMAQQGVALDEYSDENLTAIADDWEMEFYFATLGSQRLRQLSIDGAAIRWSRQALEGMRLDDLLRLLGSPASAVWQSGDAISAPFPATEDDPSAPPSDEDLLWEGTVWLPERGLGFAIGEGKVTGAAWRDAQDLPDRWAGPVTEAQRALSRRTDLADYLFEKRMARRGDLEREDPRKWPRRIVTLGILVGMVLVGNSARKEFRIWSQAPIVQAKYVSTESGPMKQFRDYVPPALRWFLPPTHPVMVDFYRVEVSPPGGKPPVQGVVEPSDSYRVEASSSADKPPVQAVIDRSEFYVPPEKPGDDMPVAYVEGNPPRVKGTYRARDSVFIDYVPIFIALGILWLMLQFAVTFLPALLRLARRVGPRVIPAATTRDPDRPELR